jgi:chemotaxis receptor (MCP) glutamine deamidase CheD
MFDHLLETYSKKYHTKLLEIRSKLKKISFCEILPNDSLYKKCVVIDQHCLGVTSALDDYPIITTYALNTCVALILYEPNLKLGALSHIDGLPGYSRNSVIEDIKVDPGFDPASVNIERIIKELIALRPNETQFSFTTCLIGGAFGLSETMICDLYDAVNNFNKKEATDCKINLIGRNLLGGINECRNIALDTRNGEIYHFNYIENSIQHNYNPQNIPKPIEEDLKHPYEPYLLHITYAGK